MSSIIKRKTIPFEYLGYSYFIAAFIMAIALHILALLGWMMMPHMEVKDVVVHTINIRLGDDNTRFIEEEEENPQPEADNSKQLEAELTKFVRKKAPKTATKKSDGESEDKPDSKAEVPQKMPDTAQTEDAPISDDVSSPRQFVRAMPSKFKYSNYGNKLGNSDSSDAEIRARYEQIISLWIQKFKVYPEIARARMMQGETKIRIRIDRRGNIRYRALEYSTGYTELDKAAFDMVRRANPVPAVPDNYPSGDLHEFLIPVDFYIR
ncbi:MAG: TonB family protein [Rickettsiales bacterium]